MRLLTEHMAVPEINAATDNNNRKKNSTLAVKVAETTESRNLNLAVQVEKGKLGLINALSDFPITALWIIEKYGQMPLKDDNEEENNISTDILGTVKAIKQQYEAMSTFPHNGIVSMANRQLATLIRGFPFAFDDLVKLVDVIGRIVILRGLDRDLCKSLDKKRAEIITNRLNRLTKGESCKIATPLSGKFSGKEEAFLFLTAEKMLETVSEVFLAENHWLNYRQLLATANAKLVLFIANQYKGNFMDFDDLVQEGHTGLLKAVDRYKHQLGFQFSTYAGYWIRQAISRALSRSERVVRIPCGQIATINKVFRAKDEMTSKTGKEPSSLALAEYTKLSFDEINSLLAISQSAVPIETFDDEDDEQSFAPIDYLEQQVFKHSYKEIAETQLHNLVNTAVESLSSREATILCAHFGIGRDEEKTLQEIGSELNLTRERIRQIQVVALNKIKMRYGEQLSNFL